jgi:hypothetical protein
LATIDRNSLESGGEGIGGFARIPDGREPISNGKALPVLIRFRLLLFGLWGLANCFIHGHDALPHLQAAEKPGFVEG